MCTAISYKSEAFYFGRTLDLDISYSERVTLMPRNYTLPVRCMPPLTSHYAVIGMAVTDKGYPLFFEGTNEKGLSMAGLNFPDNAFYGKEKKDKINLTPYELIPWILGKCACLSQAREILNKLNITAIPYSSKLPLSPLHWIIADKSGAVTLESTKDGLKIYDNPWGVLSNNPTFDLHIINTENFIHSEKELPGGFSSEERFIRAAYLKEKSSPKGSEEESVAHFFRMLSLVSVPEGCVTKNGRAHYTRYSSCCNADTGVYYYNRSDSYEIRKADMQSYNLNTSELIVIASD